MKVLKLAFVASFLLLVLISCSGKTSPTSAVPAKNSSGTIISKTPHKITTVNPASTNCVSEGGKLTIKKTPKGAEYGICVFEDNKQCEEWALTNGNCPKGGKKVTGYDNDAQIYCAITGGTVKMGKKVATCELAHSGGTCSVDDFYEKGILCATK